MCQGSLLFWNRGGMGVWIPKPQIQRWPCKLMRPPLEAIRSEAIRLQRQWRRRDAGMILSVAFGHISLLYININSEPALLITRNIVFCSHLIACGRSRLVFSSLEKPEERACAHRHTHTHTKTTITLWKNLQTVIISVT